MTAISDTVRLRIGPSPNFPRQLWIWWKEDGVAVSLTVQDEQGPSTSVVYACANRTPPSRFDLPDRIELDLVRRELWIRSAAFDLAPDEAQLIRERLEPLGLTVKSDSPLATARSLAVAHEATPSSIPLDGERGMSPVTVSASTGSLELDNATAAHALTAHETC